MKNKYIEYGIIAMVAGIVSILVSWTLFGGILSAAIGIVMGIVVLAKKEEGQGFAIAGIIMSGIGLIIAFFLTAIIVFGLVQYADEAGISTYKYTDEYNQEWDYSDDFYNNYDDDYSDYYDDFKDNFDQYF